MARRTSPALVALLLLTIALPACSSGPKNFENENDDLRRQRENLLERVESLEAALAEARAKIAEMHAALQVAGDATSAEVLEALPRAAGIEIDRLSGPVDRDGEPGYPESIDVYVRPYDGRRRFVQVAGTLAVEARYVPLPGDPPADRLLAAAGADVDAQPPDGADAILLGTATLSPAELREAYRSSVMGTHYTVRITPRPDVRVLDGSIVLSAVLVDRVTGQRHEAWRVVRLPR